MEYTEFYDIVSTYNNELYKKHWNNTLKLHDELVEKSSVDINENKKMNDEINDIQKRIISFTKKIDKVRKTRMILTTIILIVAVYCLFVTTNPELYDASFRLIVLVITVIILIFYVIIRFKMRNTRVNAEKIKDKLNIDLNNKKNAAWKQMFDLNSLFEWEHTFDLISKTVPQIKFDQKFNMNDEDILHLKYKIYLKSDRYSTITLLKSGSINNNKFVIGKKMNMSLSTKTYTGGKMIYWTERVEYGSEVRYEKKSQFLEASVEKIVAVYESLPFLLYVNDAAPNLSFSRKASNINLKNEREINKIVKEKTKELEKKSIKSVSSKYVSMGNNEFEALFGGTDRNNEVEFRMLFTPLAQKELISIIKTTGFGDNFDFEKKGKINAIIPSHINRSHFIKKPSYYYSYSYQAGRNMFLDTNMSIFSDIFKALSPIFAIPLYQQTKGEENQEKIYPNWKLAISEYEHLLSFMDVSFLASEFSKTDNNLTASLIKSDARSDLLEVTAYGFDKLQRIEYVREYGDDGNFHTIEVPWIEYVEVSKTSIVSFVFIENLNNRDTLFFKLADDYDKLFKYKISYDSLTFIDKYICFICQNINDINYEVLDKIMKEVKDYE